MIFIRISEFKKILDDYRVSPFKVYELFGNGVKLKIDFFNVHWYSFIRKERIKWAIDFIKERISEDVVLEIEIFKKGEKHYGRH